jgi:hypothetical protein
VRNSGREVEELVRQIEAGLLPEGFKVEPRQRVCDEAGKQIAELDIVISGPLGSSSIRWLIECRDRPSEGAAPISWIEQLVGRRARLNFDRVFAVSTTGFSSAATDYAKTSNVILRTVTRLRDIGSDFMLQSVTHHIESMEFAGPIAVQPADPRERRQIDLVRPMLKRAGDSEFLPFPVFVSRNGDHVSPVDEISGLVELRYDGWLDIKVGYESIRVHLLRAPLRITKLPKTSKALLATVYAENGKPIWLEGEFEADTPKGKVISRVQVWNNADGTQSLQVLFDALPEDHFLDSVAVYGKNKTNK